ncbi:MAG: type II secretion system F family protein [Acidimicrobiales bacterium]|jgi:tight adherence protein C
MTRLVAVCILATWAGATLVFSELPWFRRLPLTERLRPFSSGGLRRSGVPGLFANRSFRDILRPLATTIGSRLSKGFGVSEELALRLERVHSTQSVAEFRTRQVGWAAAALGVAALGLLALAPPAPLALLVLIGGPLLVFLVIEQQLISASQEKQHRVFLELPIVAEQLGMLLSSGYSMMGALNRIATRSNGACASDIARVAARVKQGLSPDEGLREWARIADVAELHQLTTILLLHHDAGDLGTLISQEARSIRRETQRRLIERIERRNEQVWIPVTVATLVPGVIFLAIPFMDALNGFGAI